MCIFSYVHIYVRTSENYTFQKDILKNLCVCVCGWGEVCGCVHACDCLQVP